MLSGSHPDGVSGYWLRLNRPQFDFANVRGVGRCVFSANPRAAVLIRKGSGRHLTEPNIKEPFEMKVTISNTDKECVAIRASGILRKEENRIKVIMEELGCDERTAKRFDWFAETLSQTGIVCSEAIAGAWVSNEAFGRDGINSPEDCWPGTGGGDLRLDEETGKLIPVEHDAKV